MPREVSRTQKVLLLVEVRVRRGWVAGWNGDFGGPVLIRHPPGCPDDCRVGLADEDDIGEHEVAAWSPEIVVGDIRQKLLHGAAIDDAWNIHRVDQAVAP